MGVVKIKFNCDFCHNLYTAPGAIIIGPPDENDMTLKEHICVKCYDYGFAGQKLHNKIEELTNTLERARFWWSTQEHIIDQPIPPWEDD